MSEDAECLWCRGRWRTSSLARQVVCTHPGVSRLAPGCIAERCPALYSPAKCSTAQATLRDSAAKPSHNKRCHKPPKPAATPKPNVELHFNTASGAGRTFYSFLGRCKALRSDDNVRGCRGLRRPQVAADGHRRLLRRLRRRFVRPQAARKRTNVQVR